MLEDTGTFLCNNFLRENLWHIINIRMTIDYSTCLNI